MYAEEDRKHVPLSVLSCYWNQHIVDYFPVPVCFILFRSSPNVYCGHEGVDLCVISPSGIVQMHSDISFLVKRSEITCLAKTYLGHYMVPRVGWI